MAAYVEHNFRRGFLLDEERVRKLDSIISERLGSSDPAIEHTYRVYRADSYSYDTKKPSDITSEDNPYWQRITKIEIRTDEDDFQLKILFSSEGATISIVGEDRDRVYLLFSDIREYVQNEVCVCRRFTKNGEKIFSILPMIFMTIMLLGFMFIAISKIRMPDNPTAELLASEDLVAKINYLLESSSKSQEIKDPQQIRMMLQILLVSMILSMAGPLGLYKKVYSLFFPGNLFLIGQEAQRYQKKRRLATNILWVVVIGFLVSLASGLVIAFVG